MAKSQRERALEAALRAEEILGDIVRYHHAEDGVDHQAMVLSFNADRNAYYLQIFRPRANYWAYAVEGTLPQQFSQRPHVDLLAHPDAITLDEAVAKVKPESESDFFREAHEAWAKSGAGITVIDETAEVTPEQWAKLAEKLPEGDPAVPSKPEQDVTTRDV